MENVAGGPALQHYAVLSLRRQQIECVDGEGAALLHDCFVGVVEEAARAVPDDGGVWVASWTGAGQVPPLARPQCVPLCQAADGGRPWWI